MFKKLRVKFVAAIMSSVAVVLVIVFAGMCVAEYQRSSANVEEALSTAIQLASQRHLGLQKPDGAGHVPSGFDGAKSSSDSGKPGDVPSGERASDKSPSQSASASGENNLGASGELKDKEEPGESGESADPPDAGADSQDASESRHQSGPRIGRRDNAGSNIVPVAVYKVTETSTLETLDDFTTASIDADVLSSAADRVCQAGDGSGTYADLGLHYKKTTVRSTVYVAFADQSATDSWKTMALMLAVAGLGLLVALFFVSLVLSKWALRPVREAWDSQKQFVADASHDLKTPLTVILANTSILMKHPDHSIAAESQWVESTQVEAENMQGLVNEMLELAQVESASELKAVARERVDFSDLVDGETLLFDSIALERNCRFDCSIEGGICVEGDEAQLHKMTSTLVENAFKYVNEGGRIDVSLRRSGAQLRLEVSNTGSTISESDLPHIFDRFYRTDKARTSGAGGFGLGLAIAREIARAHGGDIACTSSPEAGTAFTVTLPAL